MKQSNINSIENVDNSNTSKSSRFIEETKDAVRKALVTMGIVASSMGPASTSSTIPASANTINRITPTTPTTIKTIGQGTSAGLLTAFDGNDNVSTNHDTDNNPAPTNETNQIDIKGESGDTAENDNLNIEAPGYKSIEINNINPADILPIIGQVEAGDKKVYEHIEHLRIAEATRIRDMMREYGAGNHSPEEYQQLMNRLHTGMTLENPKGYDNYETIGGEVASEASNHAHNERNILNTVINHANFNVVDNTYRENSIKETIDSNPNNIYILGNSATGEVDKETYLNRDTNDMKNLCKSKNLLLFAAGTNIKKKNGILKNKIYHEDINGDESGVYATASSANGKNDNNADRHLIVTIGTDSEGDIDQTNEIRESSKFPVGFHDNVLFSGRAFPYLSAASQKISGEQRSYATSYTNYTNVAVADLCFQMKADVTDVDELLEMIRSSSDLRDYIRYDLNGDGDTDDTCDGQQESQPLILMNPAGFFQKYLMPTDLPTNLNPDETITLDKGYYHGVIYQIPGAEVNIDDQWIPFTDENKDLILAQNPMNLKWRLNGNLLNNYNYKPGDTINGQIIAVDDQWNGLNISKEISINMDKPTSVVGDVNGDGSVDVADIATIIDVMAGENNDLSTKADVNGDGSVDVADIATVIDIMAGHTINAKSRELKDYTTNSNDITTPNTSATWYTTNGQRLEAKPTKPGIYIVNGEKVIVK